MAAIISGKERSGEFQKGLSSSTLVCLYLPVLLSGSPDIRSCIMSAIVGTYLEQKHTEITKDLGVFATFPTAQ